MAQVAASVAASVALVVYGPDLTAASSSDVALSSMADAHVASLGAVVDDSEPTEGEDGSPAPSAEFNDVEGDDDAPAVLAGSYRLRGASDADPVTHLMYADGEHWASVFHVAGAVDWKGLRPGDAIDVGGHRAWLGRTDAGRAVVVDDGDEMHIVLGDVPESELLLLAADVRASGSDSLGQRMREGCDRVLDDLWVAAG
jgi:hypothetical protein